MENEKSMEELLREEELNQASVGDTVTGTVVQVGERVAYVDINQATEGQIYLNYFTNNKDALSFDGLLKVGDTIKARITKIEDGKNGLVILLSCLDLLKDEQLAKLAEDLKVGNVDVKARIIKKNEKSYELRYNGLKLYMSVKDVKDELKPGSDIDVRIIEVNLDKHFAFCSHYLIVREQREKEHAEYLAKVEAKRKDEEEKRKAFLESINVGDILTGTVSKLLGYGIVVKFDNAQGLVKMRDLDHKFIKDPAEVVKVGDEVKVKVLKKENGKLELSRKACIESPYQIFRHDHNVGDKLNVKVINKLPFGLLCEVAKDVSGLLHKSEFSWNPNDNLMASTLIGDTIEVAILKLDDENEKVNLSKRVLIDNPWSRVEAHEGDVVEAKILEVSSKGLKVEAFGVDGFIPSRAVLLEGKSQKIEDYFAAGDTITAIVSEINTKRWILNLDQKAYKRLEERKQFEEYMDKQEAEVENPTLGDLLSKELKK